jgi:hypothetical protein
MPLSSQNPPDLFSSEWPLVGLLPFCLPRETPLYHQQRTYSQNYRDRRSYIAIEVMIVAQIAEKLHVLIGNRITKFIELSHSKDCSAHVLGCSGRAVTGAGLRSDRGTARPTKNSNARP